MAYPHLAFAVLSLEWFSTNILKTSLDNTLVTGLKLASVILASPISSILVAGLIAPTNKFGASCGIAIIRMMIVLTATGFALLGNSEYEILDGGVSISSVFIGSVFGLLISARVNSYEGYLLFVLACLKGKKVI